jgi:hypothetical protein
MHEFLIPHMRFTRPAHLIRLNFTNILFKLSVHNYHLIWK